MFLSFFICSKQIYELLGIIVMLIVLLLINLALLIFPTQTQIDPSWIRDVNIDAGESKAVVFDKCRTSSTPQVYNASAKFTYTQNYNKTDFKAVPKVALAQLSYDFFYLANATQLGYRISIIDASITNTSFKCSVQIVGVRVCGLHFMYIAILHTYDPFYMVQVYPYTFNATDPARDISNTGTRIQTLQSNYPNNYALPAGFSAQNYALQAWILSYVFQSTAYISLNITCSLFSTTQFQLTINIGNSFSLKQFNVTVALVDKIKIFEYTYSIYIDQVYNNQPGNFQMNMTNLTTITDYTTQYFYRNALSGLTGGFIPFASNLTYFYSYQTSSNSSLFTGYAINLRTRSCNNTSFGLYFYQNKTCIASCPIYYYTNATNKFCIKCHYSCYNCSASALANKCTACEAAQFRSLVNNTVCSCQSHYFDDGTVLCSICHSTCLECSNSSQNGCLSCDATLKRTQNGTICQCMDGYYQNTTCMACHNYCLTCSFNTVQVCLTCNSTNNRSIDNSNTACICFSGFYEVTSNCLPCDVGCLNCTGPSLCTLCDVSAHLTVKSGSCKCMDGYYQNTTCIACHNYCLTCSFNTVQVCLTCNSTNNRTLDSMNTACICLPAYYEVSSNCLACDVGCSNCTGPSLCTQCDSLSHFTLQSGNCKCMDGYYQNTSCIACHNYCVTCSFNTVQVCLTCNATNNRTLDNTNTACICFPAFYAVTQNCLPCDIGCLNCTGPSLCSLCDTSNHFTLQSGKCQCISQYSLTNSVCVLTNAMCGNGIMQLAQQCDDDNILDGDGCSSICQIQSNYTCINNATLYAYSLCYYSGNIELNLNYVYKVPLENAVKITLIVSGGNINKTALKVYLETQTAVSFKQKTRLLSPTTLTQQTFSYDITTSKLTISFKYNSDIDLSSISLQFKPSLSNGTNVRYFYATPAIGVTLVLPFNKLLTTYLQEGDRSKQQAISWVFLALIILSWIYLIVAIAYKQSAMALQFFMVLQVTYESLLQSGFIYDGWIGLIFFGKYTYGINASNIVQTQLDTLSTIGLNIPLINTLNVTVAFCLVAVLILLTIFIYQLLQRSKQKQPLQTKATNDKIQLGRQTHVEFNHASYQLKKSIFLVCLQAGIVFVFLTFRIILISICLALKESSFVLSSLIPALVILGCALVVFIFYYKFFDYEGMTQLSYRRILSNLRPQKKKQNRSMLTLRLSNFILKYHYLLIFTFMSIFAIINAVSSIGTALYLSVAVGALIWWVSIAINGNYLRKLHVVRAAINTVCLITTMITLLLQTLNILNPSQNITAPLVGLSLLFGSLIFNTTVLVRIEYKRRRNRKYKPKANKVGNRVILKERSDTEEASAEVSENRDKNPAQIDRSLIHLADHPNQKQKEERSSVSNEGSRQDTTKKFKIQDKFNSKTQHKKYPRGIDHVDQTANKWNIQQAEQQREENYEQPIETAMKTKIIKQLDFQEI